MASDHSAVSYEPSHSSLSSSFQTHLFRDNDERSHWAEVCSAFRHYADFAFCHWDNQRHRIGALPESQQKLLPKGLRPDTFEGQVRFHKYQEAVMANQYFLDCILRHAAGSMSHFSKVSSVLKSLARDWSLDGKLERDMAYGPILKKVKEYVPILDSRNYVPRICIPGAGKGRICHAMSKAGRLYNKLKAENVMVTV
jgi:N2227-like protein